jgi:hypothetical protein
MNNQTMSAELFFSMGRLIAMSSLLFIVILVLFVILILFCHERNTSRFDDHELRSDIDGTVTENKILELSNLKQYASTHRNQLMSMTTSMDSSQPEIDEQKVRSTTNLISSP